MRHYEPLVRSYAVTHPAAHVVLPQPSGWDQLLLAETGTMTVHADGGSWLVPPHRGLWAPSGVGHEIRTEGRVQVRCLYLAAGVVETPDACRVVELAEFTRALVLHAVSMAPLWNHLPRHRHLIAVLADELGALDATPLLLPMPTNPRAVEAARLLLADLAAERDVAGVALAVSTSRRTLERLFATETGMSVGRWRTQARIHQAVRLLAAGRSVTYTAGEVGYSTPSAFGAAFRQVLGTSPSRYLQRPESPHASR